MATLRTPLYREFLTPALHRRFTGAALVTLAICYGEAVLVGDKSSLFWSWFPIGKAGIKTLLLFITALTIYVLRVAQLHMGARMTHSSSAAFTQYLLRFNTFQTLAFYLFSAWWFSEIYVWSASDSADLGYISQGKSWEPKKLNERPIYLRSVFFILAIIQSGIHLYYDYDRVSLPVTVSPKSEPAATESLGLVAELVASTKASLIKRTKPLLPLFRYDSNKKLSSVIRNVLLRPLCVCVIAPFVYSIFIRRKAWDWSLSLATLLWDVPASRLSYIPPHYPSLIWRSITSGICLIFLWESSNALFTAYVAQEPLKREQPLTTESKDPMGSLLNGLKSRKGVPKTFAFWELAYITQRFNDRRKTIFTDIDRPSGPAWNQIMTLCLKSMLNISTCISQFQNPAASSPAQSLKPAIIETLPRLSAPLRQENILVNPPSPSTPGEKIGSGVGTIAKSYGQSPSPGTLKLPYSPQVKTLTGSSSQKLLTSGHPEGPPKSGLYATLNTHLMTFLRSPLGQPFRQTFRRRASAVILGDPFSETHILLSSITTLTTLALASLTEDPYGAVAKDVPTLVRTYVSTIQSIETFLQTMPVHWTDVTYTDSDRTIEEVDMLVTALKMGLGDIINAFGKYAPDLGLADSEMSIAKRVAKLGGKDQGSLA